MYIILSLVKNYEPKLEQGANVNYETKAFILNFG